MRRFVLRENYRLLINNKTKLAEIEKFNIFHAADVGVFLYVHWFHEFRSHSIAVLAIDVDNLFMIEVVVVKKIHSIV